MKDHLVGAPADVTASARLWQNAALGLREALLVTDSVGRVLDHNPAAGILLGSGPESLVGGELEPLLVDAGRFAEVLARGGAGGWFGELAIRGARGVFVGAVSVTPVEGGDGTPALVWLVRDLTDTIRAQGELRRQDRLASIGRLAAGAAHELNNPLSGITGFAQLLLEESLETGPRRYVQLIVDQAQRCQRIIQNLLVFGQGQEGRRERVALHRVVSGAMSLGGYQWRLGHVDFHIDVDPGLPPVVGDTHLLQQVVFNLMRSGVESMGEGGRLDVTAAVVPAEQSPVGCTCVMLVLQDTGEGIPPELLSQVFEPFFTTREVGSPYGPGLSIAYGIVREQGGEIQVDSAPWQGTSFRLYLPCASQTEEGTP